MHGRIDTFEAAISHDLELLEHVNMSFLVRSVFVFHPDFLAPAMRKAFHVLVLHVGVLRFVQEVTYSSVERLTGWEVNDLFCGKCVPTVKAVKVRLLY